MSFILLGILNSQAAGAVGGPAYDLLETTVLGSSQSSVSFTGVGSYTDYKHLQIRAVVRSDRAVGSGDSINITFNSDTTNNYAHHRLLGEGSSVISTASTSQPEINVAGVASAANPSGEFGANVLEILDFSDTSKNTTTRSLNGHTTSNINLQSGLYFQTTAVTSITLEPRTGTNFVTGSRFSLYGLKAGA